MYKKTKSRHFQVGRCNWTLPINPPLSFLIHYFMVLRAWYEYVHMTASWAYSMRLTDAPVRSEGRKEDNQISWNSWLHFIL